MTRVNDNRETQKAQEQERADKKNDSRSREASDRFAKMIAQKKSEKGATTPEERARQTQAKRQVTQRAKGESALQARAGILTSKFSQLMQNQGKQNIGQGEFQSAVRNNSMDDTKKATDETDTKSEKSRVEGQDDKLAAISRDDRQKERDASGGDGGGFSGGQDQQQQQQQTQSVESIGSSRVGAANLQGAQQAQGAQAPRIPPEVLQEIVQRVLVGVNEEGLNEFHIQFKNDVLGGAALQISAKDGKITAKFSTSDVNAARLLKASEGELARAFGHKGMLLERLEVDRL